jgi:hypothetical protein
VAIPIQCPECHKKYQAPDHMAGKRVKCKYCGVIFLIAADARSGDAATDMSALDELNALSESARHEAIKRPAGAAAASADIDSIFQAEYASEGAPRTNKLYVFPLSRLLDRWLPPVLLAVGLIWASYEAVNRNDTNRPWVGFFRAAVFLMAFFASVLPFTLMGLRAASRKLNYELPPSPALRTMGIFAVPFALACAMWLLLGGGERAAHRRPHRLRRRNARPVPALPPPAARGPPSLLATRPGLSSCRSLCRSPRCSR